MNLDIRSHIINNFKGDINFGRMPENEEWEYSSNLYGRMQNKKQRMKF